MAQARTVQALTIPFWTSYLLRVFAWKIILGYNCVINSSLMDLGLIKAPLWIPQMSFLVGAAALLIAIVDELIIVLRGRKPSYRIAEEERLARGDYSESV